MYSDPAALKAYAEWVGISEALAKQVRDQFFPEGESSGSSGCPGSTRRWPTRSA